MTVRTNNCFKPTLEALEDRLVPSTAPLALLNSPMPNPTSAFAALNRTLSDVVHQMSALSGMPGNEFFASQQAPTAMTAWAQGRQSVQAAPIYVNLYSGYASPYQGRIIIGSVRVDPSYLPGLSNGSLHFEAGYFWGSQSPSFKWKAPVALEQNPWDRQSFSITISYQDFAKIAPELGKSLPLQFRIEIRDAGNRTLTGDQKLGYWTIGTHYAVNESSIGGPSATMTQMENFPTDGQSAADADVALRDQFFVAMAGKAHPDGLPIITAGDWSVR